MSDFVDYDPSIPYTSDSGLTTDELQATLPTQLERKVLDLLSRYGPAYTAQLAGCFHDYSPTEVRTSLQRLKCKGYIEPDPFYARIKHYNANIGRIQIHKTGNRKFFRSTEKGDEAVCNRLLDRVRSGG